LAQLDVVRLRVRLRVRVQHQLLLVGFEDLHRSVARNPGCCGDRCTGNGMMLSKLTKRLASVASEPRLTDRRTLENDRRLEDELTRPCSIAISLIRKWTWLLLMCRKW
jgi:hypothetical protein